MTKPGPGLPKAGKQIRNGQSLTIGLDGAFKVSAGDTMSKYALILFGNATTGWNEFGRMQGGALRPLADPNKIMAGETLYHIPTHSGPKQAGGLGKQLLVNVLNGVEMHKFFHSVAWRQSLAQSARLIWNEEKGSLGRAVAADLYNLTLGKVFDPLPGVKWEPPSAEVTTGKTEDIRQRASKLRRHYWDTWIAKGQQGGPAAAVAYVNGLKAVQAESIKNLNDLHREAMALNKGIEGEIHKKLKYVAGLKLGADASLGAIGFWAPPAGIAVQLLYGGANYAIETRVATSEEEAKAAKQLVVGFTSAGVDASAVSGEHLSKRFAEIAGTYSDEATSIAKNLHTADQSVATKLASTLTLDHKLKLAGQNAAKANNLKFTAGTLKYGVGGGLYLYSVWLSYNDFKDAIK